MSNRAEQVLRPFEQNYEYMTDRIESGIEANRKGRMTLRFADEKGQPLTNVQAEFKQISHDFRFGANCFMIDELETEEKNAEYKRRFAELFNTATLPFYWCDLEPEKGKPRFEKNSPKVYRRPAPDLCLDFCRQHDIEPKLHCLNYDQWTPLWVPEDPQSVKKYLDKRMQEIATRYADKIRCMEVINETLCGKTNHPQGKHSTRFFDEPDIVEWSFEHARKYLPANELVINEATPFVWGEAFKYNRSAYYMQIERALAKGASIDAIGMQFHMFFPAEKETEVTRAFYDPRIVYAVMDRYADFGLPFQMTEITIPAYSTRPEDEQLQAQIIRHLYSMWFSHPNTEAVTYWNLADGYAAFAPQGDMSFGENYYHGALLRYDMSPKPAYETLKKMIHEEWITRASLNSHAKDSLSLRGFYGQYDLTLTANGKTLKKQIHLEKGAENQFSFIL